MKGKLNLPNIHVPIQLKTAHRLFTPLHEKIRNGADSESDDQHDEETADCLFLFHWVIPPQRCVFCMSPKFEEDRTGCSSLILCESTAQPSKGFSKGSTAT
jgi:hypothetical protein